MLVKNLLESKSGTPLTVGIGDSVSDAIAVLNRHNIGAVLVVDEKGAVKGILSERDIVRRLEGDGADLTSRSVTACMTPNPYTCAPDTSVDEVMQLMTNRRVRHLPVMENGRLVGVISIGDVVKRKIEEIEVEAAALRDYIAS